MPSDIVLGWDLGGAHLKAAAVARSGKVVWVRQLPCPLWLGLEHLDRAIVNVLEEQAGALRHVLGRERAQGHVRDRDEE